MFVKDFFFSFSLLAFAALLMTLGMVLLLDAVRRLALEAFRAVHPAVKAAPAAISTLAAAKTPDEKVPTLEEAA